MLSADIIELDGRKHILAIINDITDRKQAEYELALVREEALLRAEEMTALKTEAEARAEEMARLRAEAELRAQEAEESRQTLEALMEYVPESIVVADAPNAVVRMITKSGLDMGGLSREAIQGRRLREAVKALQFLHINDLTPARYGEMPLERAVRGEVIINEEWIVREPGGNPLPILCSAGPIRNRRGNIIGGIATWREITKIKATQKGLEDAYEREHRIADVLQRALIPTISRTIDRYAMSACYQPALAEAEVGGDFYDVFDLPDDKIAILLGDVSGKGLKAAEYTAMVKYMVRGYAHINSAPEYVLSNLNNAAYHYVQEDLFVTVFYAVLDVSSNTLTYANAGHEQPLYYNAENSSATPLDVTGRAIGIFPGGSYSSRIVDLRPGDIMMLYTDGISEAGIPNGPLGIEGIAKVLAENSAKGEEEIIKAIFSAARDAAGGRLHDDAAVLVLREKSIS